MRGIASVVVALCLLAAGGARAEEPGRSKAHTSQLVGISHAHAAALSPRRDGVGPDLRLAPFTVPTLALGIVAPPAAVARPAGEPPYAAVTRIPARSARGPPGSGSFVPSLRTNHCY